MTFKINTVAIAEMNLCFYGGVCVLFPLYYYCHVLHCKIDPLLPTMHRRDSQISPSLLDNADGTKNGFVAQENEHQGCPEYFPDTW